MRSLIAVLMLLSATGAVQAQSRVVAVSVDHVVHPVTVEIVGNALDQARRENAQVLLVRLNTPGGLLQATRELVEKIIASDVPVVSYVTPSGGRAASAGFFILQGGDVAAMAPATNTGAASPVAVGREIDETMRRKIESDTAAWLRSIVAQRGRNSQLAEETVLKARSFTEREALDSNLIELIAATEQELLSAIDGREIARFPQPLRTRGAVVNNYEPTLRQRILTAISDPNVAFILLILGALGLYVEFSSPGLILPGVAGAILLLLGLTALAVLPINWIGAALILLALALFVMEAMFTSYGILGAGGAVALVLGALLLVDAPPELRIRPGIAIAVALPFSLITIFLISLVFRAHRSKVVTGGSGMVGEIGEARTALAPAGKVFVHGELWDAVSTAPVEAGGRVRVVALKGMQLEVEPVQ
ncbi:MAG: NfeD family protein [Bryobacteraceae bacterium]